MKLRLFSIISCLLLVLVLNGQSARDYLKGKLIIYYVANPNAATASTQLLSNNDIASGSFSGAFWSNSAMSGPQSLVKALLAPSANGGDARLQNFAKQIAEIQNKKVIVYLLDDASISLNSNAESNFGACKDGNNKSWPCASNYDNNARIAGEITLGTHFLTTYNPANKSASRIRADRYATFLHELVHTQDVSDGRYHMFWINGRYYHYGADGDHFFTEVLPNLASSYKEAIANVFAMAYDNAWYSEGMNWFATGGDFIVEHKPSGAPSNASHIWLQDALQSAGVRATSTFRVRSGARYSRYRMDVIPLRYILQNEYITAVILESMRQYAGSAKFIAGLTASNDELFRVCSFPTAILFRNMCRMGLPSGVNDITDMDSSPADGGYVFPLALADFFTFYRAQSKAEFRTLFEDQAFMDPWIDVYWDSYRASVMSHAPHQSGIGDLIENVKEALNMD